MAIATAVQRENLAVAYGTSATHASLHSAAPGTSGGSEVSGGSYARKALTWAAGTTDGTVTASATFDVPAGVTVTHVGLWSAASGGAFLDSVDVAGQSFAADGSLSVTFTYQQS